MFFENFYIFFKKTAREAVFIYIVLLLFARKSNNRADGVFAK